MRPDSVSRRYGLLVASFVPLFVKAVSYLLICGYAPLGVLVVFGGLTGWGVHRGARAESIAVRIWSMAILLWGTARLGLMALFLLTSISEAHVESQFSLWYVVLSLGHLVLGVFLYKRFR